MVLKKRVFVPIAFAWTLMATGLAALALTAAPDLKAMQSLEDVQIGERGNQTRIALICKNACVVEKRTNLEFFLRDVEAALEIDMSGRSKNVGLLTATGKSGGSIIRVNTGGVVEYANTKNCTVGGRAAACIDLFFSDVTATEAVTMAPGRSPPAIREANRSAPQQISKPVLREGAPERMAVFAGLSAPERLTPPNNAATAAILAKIQPVEGVVEVRKPTIRSSDLSPSAHSRGYKAHISGLLGKNLSAVFCNNAEATLQADAWALGAMVDVGLCAAARGDLEDADSVLARLLEYTPDNYEAFVGRALIAAQAGEKSVARKYFQDALNALPPIKESNRIVAAMDAL